MIKKQSSSFKNWIGAALLAPGIFGAFGAQAQTETFDFVGTVNFNVESRSGRVEKPAITVGDGGSGPYKAILSGDSSLPTHTLYRPKNLSAFSEARKLPILAFGNGGCRNTSGEFRNFLSEIASHGYLVIAIGPAGTAAMAGSEEKIGLTKSSQLIDAIDWAEKQNALSTSVYYKKLDTSKVAVAGQSCGGFQALDASKDPRVVTTLVLNSASRIGRVPSTPPAAGATPSAPGQYGNATDDIQKMMAGLEQMARRYAPYAPDSTQSMPRDINGDTNRLAGLHAPVIYIAGGPTDIAYSAAAADFEAIGTVPVVFLNQDVGHYPATYRKPNGGDFAVAAVKWLDWQLKGQQNDKRAFFGPDCGLCKDTKWTVASKNLQ